MCRVSGSTSEESMDEQSGAGSLGEGFLARGLMSLR